MNKNIRLLVEGFFDDDIFNTDNDIKSDIEDIGEQYYNYKVGDIYYLNNEPYAVCCGEPKYFNDNKPRFCLLENNNNLYCWRTKDKLVKKLGCFEEYFYLRTFNDFKHIDEDGYNNTQIIKNNYNISEFPAFEYCINLSDNVYLPSIDELLIICLNKDKLGKYSFSNYCYWSSTLYSANSALSIYVSRGCIDYINKDLSLHVYPFFYLD